jgi:cobalt-zinc-cadmium efflux system membrane fusion protein
MTRKQWILMGAVALVALTLGVGLGKFLLRPLPVTPVVEGEQKPKTTLDIADADIAAANIAVEQAATGSLGAEVLAPATVAALPNGEAVLTAQAGGRVTRLSKRLGDAVRQGEVLALVESGAAAALSADRASADAKVVLARQVAAQERALFEQGATSRRSLETAEAALAAAEAEARRARSAAGTSRLAADGRSVEVISPLSGRVTAQHAALGAVVEPETELFRVSDPRQVQVEAQVTAVEANRIALGDAVRLLLPSGATAPSSVRSVTPTLDPQTRTRTVVLDVPRGLALAPGETLQARILPRAGVESIVIDEEAVQSLDGHDSVFTRTAKGFAVRRVIIATRSGGRAAITSGLRAGERIATRNAFLLKAEMGKGGGEE